MMNRLVFLVFAMGMVAACQTPQPRHPASQQSPYEKQVRDDIDALKLRGWDILICTNSKSDLILGGVFSWRLPFSLVSYATGKAVAVEMHTKDNQSYDQAFRDAGKNYVLRLGKKGFSNSTLDEVGGRTIPVSCLVIESGLE